MIGGMTAQFAPVSELTELPIAPRAAPRPPAVLLVDDHDLFRAGLRQLLEGQGLRVVGDARCEPAAVDMCRRTRANIVLVDTATVEGTSTSLLVQRFCDELEGIGVIMFTRSEERGTSTDPCGRVRVATSRRAHRSSSSPRRSARSGPAARGCSRTRWPRSSTSCGPVRCRSAPEPT